MRVLISGTSGWLGGELAKRLAAAGHCVTGLSRRATKLEGVASIEADLSKDSSIEAAAAHGPFDVLVHNAGCLGWCTTAQAQSINVLGTRRALDIAAATSCQKVVVASSIAAVGTAAPYWPPKSVPISPEHRNAGFPWPYALSMTHKEVLARRACGLDDQLDATALRVGNVVTFPGLVHHDGIGIEYEQSPATSSDVAEELATSSACRFPEHKMASVALSDAVACLEAATLAPRRPGFRVLNVCGPTSFSREPVADVLRAWYPSTIEGLDHFERPGHERDQLYDNGPTFDALGWRPLVDLNADVPLEPSPVWKRL